MLGGADPGNVVTVSQTYNQHRGVAHTAAMPEGLAEFFIKAASPAGGIVIDPFAGGATTIVVARRLERQSGGFEIHQQFVDDALRRITDDVAHDVPGQLISASLGLTCGGRRHNQYQLSRRKPGPSAFSRSRLVPQRHGTGENTIIYAAVARAL